MDQALRCGKLWAAGFAGFVVLDLIWIGVVASGLYRSQIGHLLNIANDKLVVNVPAALATWGVIVAGICLFVLPRTANGNAMSALLWGGLYGLVLYGTYDLTNYSLIKNWPLTITLVDIAWGAFACATVSAGMHLLRRAIA